MKVKRLITTALTLCMLCQPITAAAAPVTDKESATTEQSTTKQKTTEQSTTEQSTVKQVTKKAAPKVKKESVDYKLTDEKVALAVSSKKKLSVQGIDADSNIDWQVANSKVATVDSNGTVVGKKVGTTKVVATIDEEEVTGEVVITNPTLSKTSGIIAKGEKTSVAINGLSDESRVTSVSTSGIQTTAKVAGGKLYIQPKKVGTVKVKVSIDGKSSTYSATVTTRTAMKAIAKAKKAKGCKYSQPKRMRKGYYDCSSLIWRSYKPYGVTFGTKRYAPTAASEAKYMVKKKKVVSYKRVSSSKLLPGDVIFYSYTRNGRYRNISHVSIYIGNGRIVHAANRRVGVIEADYKYTKCIKLIARPTK